MAEGTTDPRTVLVTDSPKVAHTVVDWLTSEGIAAEVHVPPATVSSDPLFGTTDIPAVEEIEVRVVDAAKAPEAMKLLSDTQRTAQLQAIRDRKRTGTVTAVCEDCGKSSEWPATAMGTTETCPHCTGYMDIPDPDDDWSEVDFGKAEDDEEPA